jgi:hypothetical protein
MYSVPPCVHNRLPVLQAVPLLTSVTLLLFAFLCMAALIGMELFAVPFHRKCVYDVAGENEVGQGRWGCSGAVKCPQGSTCTEVKELALEKIAGFDNIGMSMLSCFQVSPHIEMHILCVRLNNRATVSAAWVPG